MKIPYLWQQWRILVNEYLLEPASCGGERQKNDMKTTAVVKPIRHEIV